MRFPDERQHVLAARRVQARCGLVEHHECGIVDERLSQLHSLFHSSRVSANSAISLLEQSNVSQGVGSAGTCHRRRQATHLRHVSQELRSTYSGWKTIMLGHVADTATNRNTV